MARQCYICNDWVSSATVTDFGFKEVCCTCVRKYGKERIEDTLLKIELENKLKNKER